MTTWLLVLLIQSVAPGHQAQSVQAIPFGIYQSSLACEDQGLRLHTAAISRRLEYICWDISKKDEDRKGD